MRALLFVLAGVSSSLPAQGLTVGPLKVFMDSRHPIADVVLLNPSLKPVDVTLATLLAYMIDSGRVSVSPDSSPSWVKPYPAHTVLAPQQRQTIRLRATAPLSLPADSAVWSRLIITSRDGRAITTQRQGITATLTLVMRQIISVSYVKVSR